MKIQHICLANRYVDNYGYQENIMTKHQALKGEKVYIIASTETYINNTDIGYLKPSSYFTEFNVPITRLPYRFILTRFITKKLRLYKGLKIELYNFKPDIIFIHGHHFLSIYEIKQYAKKHFNVKIYVDSHSDSVNCAKTWLSKYILHKIIYKWCAKIIEPYVDKFYGTLPIRCDFLHTMYGIPKEKIEYLPLGYDDTGFDLNNKDDIKNRVRSNLGLKKEDFVIVTGGRIEKRKCIIELMSFIKNRPKINLVIFGSVTNEIKDAFDYYLIYKNIFYIGWLEPEKVYDYFIMADLVVFPGTHSVLWEQAAATGTQCIFGRMICNDDIFL